MTQPSELSILRNRAAVAEELRRLLPKMEGFRAAKPLPLGLSAIDGHLPQGGLACGALHEFVPEGGATTAAFGFMTALLARICSPPLSGRMAGRRGEEPSSSSRRSMEGANTAGCTVMAYALGLDPGRLILIETAHRKETLWALEEALHSGAPAAVAGVIDRLDLKTSQRLQLAATDCGLPLFLLRPAEILESSAAATRWRVGTAPAARDRFGLIARPRWQLMLERCRNGRRGRMDGGVRSCRASFQSGCRAGRSCASSRRKTNHPSDKPVDPHAAVRPRRHREPAARASPL